MSHRAKVCVYCREEKESFHKEHVVPVCFGGSSKYLEDLVCTDCNHRFGREFEGPFLKGSGIEAFFRAAWGLQGRREYPVFGDGSYGNRVYHSVTDDFPPIEVRVAKNGVRAPLQMVVQTKTGELRHLIFEGESYKGDVRQLFDNLISSLGAGEKPVAAFLWVPATDVTVSIYRMMRREFYRWIGCKEIQGEILCCDFKGTTLTLEWEIPARQRMFAKMSLNLLFWLYPDRTVCLKKDFDQIRNFILTGHGKGSRIVHQWSEADHPFVQLAVGLRDFDLVVGIFEFNDTIYGTVYFPKVGPFIILVGSSYNLPNRPIREGMKEYEGPFRQFIAAKNKQPLFMIYTPKVAKAIRDGFIGHPEFAAISSE